LLCEGVATVVEPAFADRGVHAVADFSPAVQRLCVPKTQMETSRWGAEIAKSAILTVQGSPVRSKELTTPHRRKSSRARSMEILVYVVQRKTVEAIGGTS
jgi:hypothetical protein